MKRFEKTKGFLAGIILILLIAVISTPAFADSVDVLFNRINIKINGGDFAYIGQSYTLADGSVVPFSISYKGTVYIPLRKIGELFGKEIIWDENTSTAIINDKGYIQPVSAPSSISVPTSIILSQTNSVKMYFEFPTVPDFGVFANASLLSTSPNGANSIIYLYDLDFDESKIGEYIHLLESGGFNFTEESEGYSKTTVVVYEKDNMKVYISVIFDYLTVMVIRH